MNKRIEELAKQAGFYADKYGHCQSQFGNILTDGNDFIDLEKFAELIAKECIDIVKAGINNAEHWDSSYWDQACENRAWAIQKHFGVKL